MLKKLITFYRHCSGTVLIIFALLSPALLVGFAYMNNFAVWNNLYQATKGASKAAAQSLGKQFFSRCVAAGNNLSQCSNAGTAGTVATDIMEEMIQTQIDTNYPTMSYNIAVIVNGAVNVQNSFIQIPTRVRVTGFDDQLIAQGFLEGAFPTEMDYEVQTVINTYFRETP